MALISTTKILNMMMIFQEIFMVWCIVKVLSNTIKFKLIKLLSNSVFNIPLKLMLLLMKKNFYRLKTDETLNSKTCIPAKPLDNTDEMNNRHLDISHKLFEICIDNESYFSSENCRCNFRKTLTNANNTHELDCVQFEKCEQTTTK